jgi:hypothetical protein
VLNLTRKFLTVEYPWKYTRVWPGIARTELYLSGCETNWNDFAIEAEFSSNRYFASVKNPYLSSQILIQDNS